MDKEPILFMAGVGLVGYVILHGHRAGQDCFLCKYRGLTFLTSSLGVGVYAAFNE